ncbi:hypothetical protein PMIN01_02377 [Paraphaeosphaeria minitans]|uniref:Uncharacterized protein n=1 Tax=Paraphaeosphaeria minitans TaxID=565426 RepID=A0A9P6GQM0_9PLEO|nr:hypothetical protein PMIN01_02377 [Paraphaeosphaeria minitans]
MLSSLKPLEYAFEKLNFTHGVTKLTYTIDMHGTRNITATANPVREQCANCGAFFVDYHGLKGHFADYPAVRRAWHVLAIRRCTRARGRRQT